MKRELKTKIISSLLLCSMIGYTAPVLALTKDETVYSKLKNDGSTYETIVSTHIENDELLDVINDFSDLYNIKNVGGNENFSKNDNTIIWNADKNDIYYQGETAKQLPVEVSIKYKLNGEEISAEDVVGKEGKISIIISFINKDAHTVEVGGKSKTLYTPFVVLAGTSIDNTKNKNIQISKGKIIEKDKNTIALGVFFPGLQYSLDLNESTNKIPQQMEITMDSTDFEMGNMITYITPRVLEEDNLNITEKINELYSSVEDMQTASKKIEDGANTLKDGTQEYADKSGEFSQYMSQLANGTAEAEDGVKQLSGGINQLSSKSSALVPGVKQLADGSSALKDGINTAAASANQLSNGANSINEGIKNVSDGINTINSMLTQTDTTNTEENIGKLKELKTNLSSINVALNAQIQANSENTELITLLTQQIEMNKASIQSIDSNINSLTYTAKLKEGILNIKVGLEGNGTAENPGLKNGMNTISSGISQLASGLTTINEKSDALVSGTKELSSKANMLVSGINTIKNGSDKLNTGLKTVNESTNTLYSASSKLSDGSKTIAEGMVSLSDGINEFNSQAINKIYNYVENDVKDLADRVEALDDLSKRYINFAMKDEKMNGNVKFILITDPLKKEK